METKKTYQRENGRRIRAQKEAYQRLPAFLKLVDEGWSNTCAMGRARITDYMQTFLMSECEEFRRLFKRAKR